MKISKIELCNFRATDRLSLNLSDRLNVFVGVNGSGKSTIIDALAISLSWLLNRIQRENVSGRHIPEMSIRNGTSASTVTTTVNMADKRYQWMLSRTVKGENIEKKSRLNEVSALASVIREEAPESGLPVFAFYPVNRNVLDIPLRIRQKHTFEQFECYDEALTGAANFRHFFEWFRNREDLENENRKYHQDLFFKPDNVEFPDRQLTVVRKALESFLPDFQNFSVRRNPLRMVAFKNKEELRIEQLSDGEKTLIALIGDLARRIAIANPESKTPLKGKGIVLIDEIDLHLHPEWQRMIVPKLTKVFPNCQFIISTHSPQILSHVKPENIFLLKLEKEGIRYSHPSESYGKNTDRILEDLMQVDARPKKEKQMIHELFEIIQKGSLKNARNKVRELKDLIGEDPELVKADVLIKRKEIIGK